MGQLQTVQIKCKGKKKCVYEQDCPFEAPAVGQPCQLEVYYQQKWAADYMNEFGIFAGERQLMSLISSLVQTELQLMRQQAQLQNDGLEQIVITETESGDKRIDKKLHNMITLIDQLERRKIQLLKRIKEETEQRQTEQVVGNIVDLLSSMK